MRSTASRAGRLAAAAALGQPGKPPTCRGQVAAVDGVQVQLQVNVRVYKHGACEVGRRMHIGLTLEAQLGTAARGPESWHLVCQHSVKHKSPLAAKSLPPASSCSPIEGTKHSNVGGTPSGRARLRT